MWTGDAWAEICRIEDGVRDIVARGDRVAVVTKKNELYTASVRALAKAARFRRAHAAE